MVDASSTLLSVGLVFLIIGVPMLGVAAVSVVRTRRFLKTAVASSGVIVDLIESSDSEGTLVYQAVVEFEAADGRTIRWTESMTTTPAVGQPGEPIPVRYDPSNPEDARIDRPFRMWFLPGLLGLLGGCFGGVGALFTMLGLLL